MIFSMNDLDFKRIIKTVVLQNSTICVCTSIRLYAFVEGRNGIEYPRLLLSTYSSEEGLLSQPKALVFLTGLDQCSAEILLSPSYSGLG